MRSLLFIIPSFVAFVALILVLSFLPGSLRRFLSLVYTPSRSTHCVRSLLVIILSTSFLRRIRYPHPRPFLSSWLTTPSPFLSLHLIAQQLLSSIAVFAISSFPFPLLIRYIPSIFPHSTYITPSSSFYSPFFYPKSSTKLTMTHSRLTMVLHALRPGLLQQELDLLL